MQGYEVRDVYGDDISGRIEDRPGIRSVLMFLQRNRAARPIVLVDDTSRLAGDIRVHHALRDAIAQAGGTLETPNGQFTDDPDAIVVENIMGTLAQHHSDRNAKQTIDRMTARVQAGYYVFPRPVGYKYKRVTGRGMMLVRDEPVAGLLAEALEGFALGHFALPVEVRRFLESKPEFIGQSGRKVTNQFITNRLRRNVYAGLVEAPMWGVSLRKGLHEPLIDMATWQSIQDRLDGKKALAPVAASRNTSRI
jgi:hypothetical protein